VKTVIDDLLVWQYLLHVFSTNGITVTIQGAWIYFKVELSFSSTAKANGGGASVFTMISQFVENAKLKCATAYVNYQTPLSSSPVLSGITSSAIKATNVCAYAAVLCIAYPVSNLHTPFLNPLPGSTSL
jgi:hypothetical protein